jgi:hypothetical protein
MNAAAEMPHAVNGRPGACGQKRAIVDSMDIVFTFMKLRLSHARSVPDYKKRSFSMR